MTASDVEFVDGLVKDAAEEIEQLRKDKEALLGVLHVLANMIEDCESCDGTGHARGNTKEDEACRSCGGVGEVFGLGVVGEIGFIRAVIEKAERR